jgi:hypothetical protein
MSFDTTPTGTRSAKHETMLYLTFANQLCLPGTWPDQTLTRDQYAAHNNHIPTSKTDTLDEERLALGIRQALSQAGFRMEGNHNPNTTTNGFSSISSTSRFVP